jgi:hypothetical protein
MSSVVATLFCKLAERLPDFSEYRITDPGVIKGRDRVLHRARNGVLEFVVLVRHSSEPKVTVELGWSNRGRFPSVSPRPCFHEPSRGDYFPEYIFRVRSDRRSRPERWWPLNDSSDEARLGALADDMSAVVEGALGLVEAASQRSQSES